MIDERNVKIICVLGMVLITVEALSICLLCCVVFKAIPDAYPLGFLEKCPMRPLEIFSEKHHGVLRPDCTILLGLKARKGKQGSK